MDSGIEEHKLPAFGRIEAGIVRYDEAPQNELFESGPIP
jgi:hypothetical protein